VDRSEDTYTRRISAVLVADVSGFSALMGEDDERTARDVRRIQNLVQAIVADLQGRAEPQAGDSIFASFEAVGAITLRSLRNVPKVGRRPQPPRRGAYNAQSDASRRGELPTRWPAAAATTTSRA
jgi:class 3 adenylate cyclase